MSKEIAVKCVRKWHLSLCHDLCLPTIPIMVKGAGGDGRTGLFVGNRTREPSGFVAIDLGGVIVGESTGGMVSTTCRIFIFATDNFGEGDYLHALAHELRHAWQFLNNVPPTEQDCNEYASRFLKRFPVPACGAYHGLVDEKEYEVCEARKRAAKDRKLEVGLWIGTFFLGLLLSIVGFGDITWTPTFGTGGDMYRLDQTDQANIDRHTARVKGCFLFLPIVLWVLAWSVNLAKTKKGPPVKPKAKKTNKREERQRQQEIAYAMRISSHPDNGKTGRWEVCGCLVTAKTAQEALEKVAAIGQLEGENPVPRYRGNG